MFYLNSTLNFGIPPVFVFQLEVYYKVDRLLTGLTAQQKGTTARWYSNKTSLHTKNLNNLKILIGLGTDSLNVSANIDIDMSPQKYIYLYFILFTNA